MASLKYFLAMATLSYLCVENQGFCLGDNKEYRTILETNTGYDYKDLVSTLSDKNTKVDIEKLERKIIDDLKCSFTFSGLHYVQLSRYLIENENQETFNIIKEMPHFFFDNSASSMLTILQNYGQSASMDSIWWTYMYSLYFRMLVTDDIQYNRRAVASTCNDVEANLLSFLAQCDPNTTFNYTNNNFEKTDHFQDLPIENHNSEDSFEERSSSILALKQRVASQVAYNENLNHMNYNQEYFSWDRLNLSHLMNPTNNKLKYLVCDFGELIDCDTTLNQMFEDYNTIKYSQHIIERFTSQRRFQNKFICLLKIIMLQIIVKHMHYVNDLLPFSNYGIVCAPLKLIHIPVTLARFNISMSNKLSKFAKLLNLHHNDELVYVSRLFHRPILNFLDSNYNQDVIEQLTIILNNLLVEFYDSKLSYTTPLGEEYLEKSLKTIKGISESMNIIYGMRIASVKRPLTISLLSAIVFVNFVQLIGRDVNYEAIQLFNKFTLTLKGNNTDISYAVTKALNTKI